MSYPGQEIIDWFKANLILFKEQMNLSDQQLSIIHGMYMLIGPSLNVDQDKAVIASRGLGLSLDISEIEHITNLAGNMIKLFNAAPEDREYVQAEIQEFLGCGVPIGGVATESKFDVLYNELLT